MPLGHCPLKATVQAMRQIADLSDEMQVAIKKLDFSLVDRISEKNREARAQLAEVKTQLAGFVPTDSEHLRLVRELKELGTKVRSGDRLFGLWQQDLVYHEELGNSSIANTLLNAKHLPATPSVNTLADAFRGKPAILVAAGPSRDKQFPLIEQYKNKALVITINRCIDAFIEKRIQPDLVLVTDPQDIIVHHTTKVSAETIPTMVSRISVFPDVFSKPTRSRFCFSDGNVHELGVMRALGQPDPLVLSGGSVAHCSLKLALEMGCDPIILVGQDLAYSGDRLYAESDADDLRLRRSTDGTVALREGSMRGIPNPRAVLLTEVPGFYGGSVTTDTTMARMRESFELIVSEYEGKSRIINATEGGCHITGMEHMSFERALGEIQTPAFDASEMIHKIFDAHQTNLSLTDSRAWIDELVDQLVQLIQLANQCQTQLRLAKQRPKLLPKVTQLYNRLTVYHEQVQFLLLGAHIGDRRQAFIEKRGEMDPYQELERDFQAMVAAAEAILPLAQTAQTQWHAKEPGQADEKSERFA